MTSIRPVILCGGSGTRLWPISRSDYPKQFVNFPKIGSSDNSLFRYAMKRVHFGKDSGVNVLPPTIMASSSYRFFISDQIPEKNKGEQIFLEPGSRNTAPSLTMAALLEQNKDTILVVLPSDQAIDDKKFNQAVLNALPACEDGTIVLLGIQPTYPETGYGYIKAQERPSELSPVSVDRFVEKPSEDTAKRYLDDGTYLWNSGIFILKASTWLKALHQCRPDIEKASQQAWLTRKQLSDTECSVAQEAYLRIPSVSVDYAVLEHCKECNIPLKVIGLFGKWTDLGSWKSVFEAIPKDTDGNFFVGQVISKDTTSSMVVSTTRLVATNGINGVAVVETNDAVLVTTLDKCQGVKDLVAEIKEKNFPQAVGHRIGYRPWGWYDAIDEGQGFKVKRITVKPGCSLSLQRHRQRAEHWIVVSGEAIVQIGNSIHKVAENESIYIDKFEIHRLTNEGEYELVLIEVQIGTYLGEDDIERLDDKYGRI